jgi:hypothetical protein
LARLKAPADNLAGAQVAPPLDEIRMPFNTHPLRPVSDEDAGTYARDGVVCLRKVFDPEWLQAMERPARQLLIDKVDFGLLPNNPGRYMARTIPEFRRFAFDAIFAKKPQAEMKTT